MSYVLLALHILYFGAGWSTCPVTNRQALCGCGPHCSGAYIIVFYNCLCGLLADNRLL